MRRKEGLADYIPSRLFLYWNGRALEGTTDQDAGAEIRDVMHQIAVLGSCPETDWPFDDTKVTVCPPPKAYGDATADKATNYYRLTQDLGAMKDCLASGYPFVFGFTVYDSFEGDAVAQTGIMPMPSPTEGAVGGHAVMAVGYNDAKQWVIVRNSWGADWGDKGYFYMPYQYIASQDLASDFWTIRRMAIKQGT